MVVCRYFKGDRPCKHYWDDRSYNCEECSHHSPVKENIILIKLDAIGDVLRATPLAVGLKKKYPESLLTWVVGEESYELLKDNPYIDRLLKYNHNTVQALMVQEFDILINLDKASHSAALAMRLDAKEKRGYGLDKHGVVFPLNEEAKYHFDMCIDNWGKKTENVKTYQEMIFDIAGLRYDGEEYVVNIPKSAVEFAYDFLKSNDVGSTDVVIGLNTGCGPVYPHKKWVVEYYIKLINMMVQEFDAKVLLFGGKTEIGYNSWLSSVSDNVIDLTNRTTIVEFASLINVCDVVITGDTAGMHLAIALKRPVVALFGPTPSQEIDVYGKGVKLVGKVDCINCYDQFECDRKPTCMETITPEEVFDAVRSLIDR
ncbi:MAG: glycosyltransferase family 9 protein [archaeon]